MEASTRTDQLAEGLLDRVASAPTPVSISSEGDSAEGSGSVDQRIESLRAERDERGFGSCQGAPYSTWGN